MGLIAGSDDHVKQAHSHTWNRSHLISAVSGAFKSPELLNKLEENNALWGVAKHFTGIDLSDETLGRKAMGNLFEKLMYRCFSGNGQVAVELCNPRDFIRMTVDVLINSGDDGLR